MIELVLYFLLAIFIGWLGRNTQIGFVGFLMLSLLVTPIPLLFVLLMTKERRPSEGTRVTAS